MQGSKAEIVKKSPCLGRIYLAEQSCEENLRNRRERKSGARTPRRTWEKCNWIRLIHQDENLFTSRSRKGRFHESSGRRGELQDNWAAGLLGRDLSTIQPIDRETGMNKKEAFRMKKHHSYL